MAFKKASPENRRLKIYLYGKAGAGKTYAAVQFPNPAVYDLEHKALSFSDDFEFDIKEPSYTDPSEILLELNKEIDDLMANPGDYKTLIIDSASVLTDLVGDKHLRRLREKKQNPLLSLGPAEYKLIKSDIKSFVNKLMLLDMNVVMTARIKNQYDTESLEMMKIIGTEPDAHKEFPALFHIVIELQGDGPSDPRTAIVRRDNTRRLPAKIEDFSFEKLLGYFKDSGYDIAGTAKSVKPTMHKRKFKFIDVQFNGETIQTAGVTGPTLERLAEICTNKKITKEELADKLSSDYPGAESPLDLREDEAQLLLKDLEQSGE